MAVGSLGKKVNDDWYDVRGMTRAELTAFSVDLERKELAARPSG